MDLSGMEEDTIDLFALYYSDLVQLSADELPASPDEIQRLRLISDQLMHNIGPNGPGLLSIIGVPRAPLLRQALLPLARKLALLSNDDLKRILKVGESADVLSKGKLCATLHCVSRPAKIDNLSRETFVVFLQPAWNKIFSYKEYPMEHLNKGDQNLESDCEGTRGPEHESNGLIRKISGIVPPLSSRLKDGMTFADFAKETTRKYYGGSGLQSSR